MDDALEVFELRTIFGGVRENGVWRRRTNQELVQLYGRPSISCSVYVAELAAVYCALQIIETMPPDSYFIYTDSFSSVEAIRSLQSTGESAYFLAEIRKTLNNLAARSFSISVVWVRAHCSIPGNEEAQVTLRLYQGFINLDKTRKGFMPAFKTLIKLSVLLGSGRWTFSIRPTVSKKAWFKGLDLTRGFIRTMSRLMSNHYSSKAHLYRINMSDTNLCDCGQGYQDIDHIVWTCSDHQDHRTKLKDTLRAPGRPPEIPIRDVLAQLDLELLLPIFQFLQDSKISV